MLVLESSTAIASAALAALLVVLGDVIAAAAAVKVAASMCLRGSDARRAIKTVLVPPESGHASAHIT